MSAAEKLKALDEAMPRAEAPSSDSPITTVRYALPQIVAVVEAAERVRDAVRRDENASWEVQASKPPFDSALAALDEALEDVT